MLIVERAIGTTDPGEAAEPDRPAPSLPGLLNAHIRPLPAGGIAITAPTANRAAATATATLLRD